MNIIPLDDRVVVEFLAADTKSPGGLFLPGTAQQRPQMANVVAVGPGRAEDGRRVEPVVKVGDTVLLSKYSGTEIQLDGKPLTILHESEILAIVVSATSGKRTA